MSVLGALLASTAMLAPAPAAAPMGAGCQLCGKEFAVECGACSRCCGIVQRSHRPQRRARQIIARRKFGRAS